jgi:hypothetical protein
MNAVRKLLGESVMERWCFTDYELANPEVLQACRGEDEFIAGVSDPETGGSGELGVIVQRNGTVSNRWEDGTAGVPDDTQEEARNEEVLVKPLSSRAPDRRDSFADNWRDVDVAEDGSFKLMEPREVVTRVRREQGRRE